MMRRLTIAIDCDDVLLDTAEAVVAAYNATYGTELHSKDFYNPADLKSWGTSSEEEATDRIEAYLVSDEFSKVVPYDSAIKTVAKLASMHELHLVTGRHDELGDITRNMLDTYFPGCFTSVQHTNYFKGHRRRSKGEVCKQLGANVLIDDHIAHGRSVLESGLQEVIIFGSYPWNQSETLLRGMTRCLNWVEVEKEIERIAHAR